MSINLLQHVEYEKEQTIGYFCGRRKLAGSFMTRTYTIYSFVKSHGQRTSVIGSSLQPYLHGGIGWIRFIFVANSR
jgi:hypothetical protein